ncbi:MAG: hypothetical protein A4S09_08375 [Proteobacteria bacterium SG_bin7]|nr:MAG: hypothetical protein A4S09_08375 [Proteobacteria bacterium SG_bin7]
MDHEQFEEMCAAYVLGILSPDEVLTFERALANATTEQKEVFTKMQTTARHLPLSNELVSPNEEVKSKIMNQIGANVGSTYTQSNDDTIEISATKSPSSLGAILGVSKLFNFKELKNINVDSQLINKVYRKLHLDRPIVALSVPLVLLLTCMILYFEQEDIRAEYGNKLAKQEQILSAQNMELQDTKARFADLEIKLQQQDQKIAELDKRSTETTQMMAAKDKEMSDMKVATAQGQEMMAFMQTTDLKVAELKGMTPYPQGRAKVMFSPKSKMVYIHITNVPIPPANKDYQLWMMEGSKAVSAGVLPMIAGNSLVKVTMGMVVPTNRLSAFIVTLEPKGGVVKATGPAFLKGNVKL